MEVSMRYAVILLALLVSGCTQYRAIAKDRAQEAAQAQLEVSRYAYCAGNTTGALLRMTAEDRAAFLAYCEEYAK